MHAVERRPFCGRLDLASGGGAREALRRWVKSPSKTTCASMSAHVKHEKVRLHTSSASSLLFMLVRLRASRSASTPSERMLALARPRLYDVPSAGRYWAYLGCRTPQAGRQVVEVA